MRIVSTFEIERILDPVNATHTLDLFATGVTGQGFQRGRVSRVRTTDWHLLRAAPMHQVALNIGQL
ncbi:MAG TPA: hypothetical protein PKM43_03595, partial [Verrucomicrobiota bacterium]|nr:hypothetical protein [Verrucomicrobiota bacterium]